MGVSLTSYLTRKPASERKNDSSPALIVPGAIKEVGPCTWNLSV